MLANKIDNNCKTVYINIQRIKMDKPRIENYMQRKLINVINFKIFETSVSS